MKDPAGIAILFVLVSFSFFYCGKSNEKAPQEDLSAIETRPTPSKPDTLWAGFTHWWPNAGPFIKMCGDDYSLVFLGEVKHIYEVATEPGYLFKSKEGIIEISEILEVRDLALEQYAGQKYFLSECFYGSDLKPGDNVIVFCYEYEGRYCIPGKESIIKIPNFNASAVKSIQRYLQANQNPLAIESDTLIWEKMGFGNELRQNIDCHRMLKNN